MDNIYDKAIWKEDCPEECFKPIESVPALNSNPRYSANI
jgi:hypothetical protein